MLELELGGRKITTMDDKQILTVNGTPIEVEKIGQAIYFNKFAVNLVIPEETTGGKTNWTKIALAGGGVVAAGVVAMNFDAALAMGVGVYEFVVPYVTDFKDFVGGYVDGTGTGGSFR